jgi:hypothetical protein
MCGRRRGHVAVRRGCGHGHQRGERTVGGGFWRRWLVRAQSGKEEARERGRDKGEEEKAWTHFLNSSKNISSDRPTFLMFSSSAWDGINVLNVKFVGLGLGRRS